MLRIIVSLAFIGHGLGHATGFLAVWPRSPAGFTDAPWILPGDVKMQRCLLNKWGPTGVTDPLGVSSRRSATAVSPDY